MFLCCPINRERRDMLKRKIEQLPRSAIIAFEFAKVFFFVYCFLVSIDLMGIAFKSQKGLAETLMTVTSNPFIGLIIGIVVTSIIQSSSTTTSIIVAMVGAGTLPFKNAIPMVMGANIGTTVTCTIVSFSYLGRKTEFERSFRASIIHDIFNISATLILFPLELYTGIIYRSAGYMTGVFDGIGGFKFVSPLKIIIRPVSSHIASILNNHIVILIVALACMFFSMAKIVDNMKGIIMEKVERILNRYLFKNALISLIFGLFLTAFVQSSSIATSIIVPLVGAGLLTIEQIFPYTLGANLGTTVTALLAALTIGNKSAMSIAFSHMLFNIFGISIIYPFRKFLIWTAKEVAHFVAASKKHFLIFILIFILLHFIPVVFAILN